MKKMNVSPNLNRFWMTWTNWLENMSIFACKKEVMSWNTLFSTRYVEINISALSNKGFLSHEAMAFAPNSNTNINRIRLS